MANMIKLRDDVHDAVNGFNQVNIGDEVDGMWGYRELTITISDILHLITGGCLYTDDGEYATVIALDRNNTETFNKVVNLPGDKSGDN